MNIQKIIDAIDDNLIERGKDNMTLGYANQILLLRGLINDNIVLKTLLQKGQIPHAYQTKHTPHQWRIPLSKGGKKRKKKIENVQDLGCFEDQPVEEGRMQKMEKIQYPFKPMSKYQSEKTKNWIIAGVAILVLIVLINLGENNSDGSNNPVKNSGYDASVHQVERYLKRTLMDRKSYDSMEWSRVNEENGEYWVRHKYRAKNSFGGYVIKNQIFYLDKQGNVTGVKDLN